jgi:hypothetical protein
MRHFFIFSTYLILLLLSIAFYSCGDDGSDLNFLKQLTQTQWKVESAYENEIVTHEFDKMWIRFSPTDFMTSMSNNEVWPAHGDFTVEKPLSRVLIRADGTAIMVSKLDETMLVLDFQFTSAESISGRKGSRSYHFTFQSSN